MRTFNSGKITFEYPDEWEVEKADILSNPDCIATLSKGQDNLINAVMFPTATNLDDYKIFMEDAISDDGGVIIASDFVEIAGLDSIKLHANMDTPATLPWASTSTDILGQSYSFNPSAPTYIPMWGVRSVSFDASPGTQQNLDDVYMLRAVAKVTVQLDETIMKGWTIEAITMNRWNNKGYCLPSWVNDLNDTQDLTFNQSENVYNATDVLQTTPIDFTAATASTASKNLYLPEYDNTSAGVTPATISVKLRKPDGTSEGQTYTLQFVKYDDKDAPTGTPYDIVRNHWYKYTIYKNTERTLSVKLTVRKWNKENHPTIVM